MQVDTALSQKVREQFYPFTELSDDANVLVMPNLAAANITYKILQQLSNAEVVGPILLGMDHADDHAARRIGRRDRQHDRHHGGSVRDEEPTTRSGDPATSVSSLRYGVTISNASARPHG